mmetsp:Transcript_7810/g.19981  ORF Transcript_7810/g.19981 Transcript_7810/m.19981 type:complete len:311 (+) Transcript_7810:211-1143(+)
MTWETRMGSRSDSSITSSFSSTVRLGKYSPSKVFRCLDGLKVYRKAWTQGRIMAVCLASPMRNIKRRIPSLWQMTDESLMKIVLLLFFGCDSFAKRTPMSKASRIIMTSLWNPRMMMPYMHLPLFPIGPASALIPKPIVFAMLMDMAMASMKPSTFATQSKSSKTVNHQRIEKRNQLTMYVKQHKRMRMWNRMEMSEEKASKRNLCQLMFLMPASLTWDFPACMPVSTSAACLFFNLCRWKNPLPRSIQSLSPDVRRSTESLARMASMSKVSLSPLTSMLKRSPTSMGFVRPNAALAGNHQSKLDADPEA